ncbi:hypothetical protein [Paracoccus laeviglucosivorans]|uniref:Uncharacterized protein n=1 Tax=Paracoccus laeviglucosivorans TaxID=1197861 RepID=A0A521FV81_9RHOB|nr:hypothetical protein [Paracoccus laeviglucosivorans]SMP00115.1 hypothetical protein SAMN06265221_1611 [Paracoccus laeviglucosivorans]
MTNHTVAKRARPFEKVDRDGQTGWLYEWDNGEFTLLFIPENFSFSLDKSIQIGRPTASEG